MPLFPFRFNPVSYRGLLNGLGTPDTVRQDTWQTIITHLPVSRYGEYMAKLNQRGFNAFRFMATVRAGGGTFATANEPNSVAGNPPFNTAGWLDTMNTSYWNNDFVPVVSTALAYGIIACPFIDYLGYQGGLQGWKSYLSDAHNTGGNGGVCYGFGANVATLLLPYPNVIMYAFGDNGGGPGADDMNAIERSRFKDIINGFKSVDPGRLWSCEPAPPDTKCDSVSGFTFGVDLALNDVHLGAVYAAGPAANGECYTAVDQMWDQLPRRPIDTTDAIAYDNLWSSADLKSRQACRKFGWWAALAGGAPHGRHLVDDDRFNNNDATAALATMDDVATLDAAVLNQFLMGFPVHLLRASGAGGDRCGRTLVVSGGGSGQSKVVAMQAVDGSFMAVYVPPVGTGTQTISVDCRGMRGNIRFRWLDPVSGLFLPESNSAGQYAVSPSNASLSVTTPGDHTDGNDAVLIGEAVSIQASGVGRAPATGPSGMGGSRMCSG